MNNVKDLDCTKCLHRKMCDRKISHCDFVSEYKYCIKPCEPTADVQEVKHGHWRKTEYAWSICSNCLSTPKMYFPFNYCPWCGAKMDGEGSEQ